MNERGLYLGGDRQRLLAKLRSLVADLEAVVYPDGSEIDVLMDSWAVAKREVPCLVGKTRRHPKFTDGSQTFSSELFYFDEERRIARTLSRWYRLGPAAESET